MKRDRIQRILDLMSHRCEKGGFCIVILAQTQILFCQKPLLLIVFPQMKIEHRSTADADREKRREYVDQPVCFRDKRSNVLWMQIGEQAEQEIEQHFRDGNEDRQAFFQHQNRKNDGKYEKQRHSALISAARKKHDREKDEKNQHNRDEIAALVMAAVIRVEKQSAGDKCQ